MKTRTTAPKPVPAPLEAARRRFEEWRRTRAATERIPDRLWRSAAKLARRYGVFRTARTLGLDYMCLKRRAGLAKTPARVKKPTFVEVAPLTVGSRSGECLIEVEDRSGAKLRIEARGIDGAQIGALARSFLGGEG